MLDSKLFLVEFENLMDLIGCNVSPDIIAMYYMKLKNVIDNNGFLRAIRRIQTEWQPYGKEYPSILDFIRYSQLNDDEIEEIAYKAYNTAKKTALKIGSYMTPIFEDKLISDVIATITDGWVDFHNKVAYIDSDDRWVKNEFIRMYKNKFKRGFCKDVVLHGRNYTLEGKDNYIIIKSNYQVKTFLLKNNNLNKITNKKINKNIEKIVKKIDFKK